ncbi:MAG: hypothetical protein QOJ07_830 [Thermoleophilaceae bacterium]|nr:hypothetical protein [Thermoleophilaceae bacterium]
MSTTRERAVVALPPDEALALWLDTNRWQTFVDGLARIVDRPASWPEPGTTVIWESRPGGRGRVTERIVEHDPAGRVVVDVFEDQLVGRQTATFERDQGGCRVLVELDYKLTQSGPLRAIAGLTYVRGALRASIGRTLRRFATEAAEEAQLRSP